MYRRYSGSRRGARLWVGARLIDLKVDKLKIQKSKFKIPQHNFPYN
jgi:hypothetical protein